MSYPEWPTNDQLTVGLCLVPNGTTCEPLHFPCPSAPPISSYSPHFTYDRITQQTFNNWRTFSPILHPLTQFYPQYDAEILFKTIHESVPDIKSIIQILTRLINVQREDVRFFYGVMYNRDLLTDLQSNSSGNCEMLIAALMTPTFDFLAKEIRNAINGILVDEETVIEILCNLSNAEINYLKLAYYKLFKKNLEEDNMGNIPSYFHRFLVSLSQGQRFEGIYVDQASAKADAQSLIGEKEFDNDQSTFNVILRSRSYIQLQQIFLEYRRLAGRDFEDMVRSEFSKDIQKTLRAIVKCIKDNSAFYAERLHHSMIGLKKNECDLIRIVTTRCEIDMGNIKKAYNLMYGQTLDAAVLDNTSGNFKECLLSLIQC